ncbi:MAG: hypothetical protein ACSLFD_02630 [Solirubrobacterales bacterium]
MTAKKPAKRPATRTGRGKPQRRTRAKMVQPDISNVVDMGSPKVSLIKKRLATAATHRQIIPTGTLAEVRSILPAVDELEADDLDIAKYHHQFTDQHVQAAAAFIDRSGIATEMERHHKDAKEARGRKETIPFRAILIALWIVANDGGNLWMTNLRDVLFHKMTPESRDLLGIKYPDRPTPLHEDARNDKTPLRDRMWDQNSERAVGRAFHRMLKTIDPSVHPKNRIMTWQELAEKSLPLSLREQQKYQARLDWVCNRLLETAFKTLPRKIRRMYKGSAVQGVRLHRRDPHAVVRAGTRQGQHRVLIRPRRRVLRTPERPH